MRRIATRFAAPALLLVAALLPRFATGAVIGDLYVTSDASDVVRTYDFAGNYLGVFTPSINGVGQLGIHFGATNNRVLVGHFGGGVDEFDALTGAFIKTYNPGGGVQWTGLYGPNGNVLIGSWNTQDVREYDPVTGAFIQVLVSVTDPADMRIGPNGNLFVCAYGASLTLEVDPSNGNIMNIINQPFGARPNDIEFNPSGDVMITAMGTNVTHLYNPVYAPTGAFAGTGWNRPHGIEMHPNTGNVLAVDGVTAQVHEFHPTTYAELDAAYLNPPPGDKIVDLAFRPPGGATSATRSSWGRIKRLFR